MSDKIVKHGIENVYYAEIANGVFGTPVRMYGAIKGGYEVENSPKDIFADNVVFMTLRGKSKIEGELTLLSIPESYATYALGKELTDFGGLIDSGYRKPHALMWERVIEDAETGDQSRELTVLYNVSSGDANIEDSTDEDEIIEQNLTIPLSINKSQFALSKDGKMVGIMTLIRTDENATIYDSFKQKVILPSQAV